MKIKIYVLDTEHPAADGQETFVALLDRSGNTIVIGKKPQLVIGVVHHIEPISMCLSTTQWPDAYMMVEFPLTRTVLFTILENKPVELRLKQVWGNDRDDIAKMIFMTLQLPYTFTRRS